MGDNKKQIVATNKVKVFETQQVRTAWNAEEEEWYFSAVDVCRVLASSESKDIGAYWRKLKERLTTEGSEVVTNCHGLKMLAADGKMRVTDALSTRWTLRLIQSIPSPKAEPFKMWLAQVGSAVDTESGADSAEGGAVDTGGESFEEKMYGDVWTKEKYLNWMWENPRAIREVMSESAFRGVRIETISFVLQTNKKPLNTAVESYINGTFSFHRQDYIADTNFPYWLIYRNDEFDCVAEKMQLDIFTSYRDRKITKAVTKPYGFIRVLKSRNIGNNKIIDIAGYDCYVDDAAPFAVSKYMNKANCVLLPNLSYAPRACFLPKDSIADGSVAILTLKDDKQTITESITY